MRGSATESRGSAVSSLGQVLQHTATVRNAQGNVIAGSTVAWSTRDSTVAGVFAGGLAVARSLGSATIIATSKGVSGYSDITVSLDPVASVTVTPSSASVQVGDTTRLQATTRDALGNILTGRTITWASSNAAVAAVDVAGLVKGVAAGTATVTATSEGVSGPASVAVTAPSAGGLGTEGARPQAGWVLGDDFEQERLPSYFQDGQSGGNFIRAAGVGVSGSSGMRARWAATGQVAAGVLPLAFGETPQSYFKPGDAGPAPYREGHLRG